jgi:hypothetical protein
MRSDEKLIPAMTPAEGKLHRRSFLQVLGAAFGTAVLPEVVTACAPGGGEMVASSTGEALSISGSVSVVRTEDMLVLTISFVNLMQSGSDTLMKLSSTQPAQIVLDFPPQAILEDAVTVNPGAMANTFSIPSKYTNGSTVANAVMGGPTRLIFQLPDAYTPVPYALSQILGLCATSSLVLAPVMTKTATPTVPAASAAPSGDPMVDLMLAHALAQTDPAASGRLAAANSALPTGLVAYAGTGTTTSNAAMTGASPEPTGMSDNSVTQIELPYRVKLSPNAQAGWTHASLPLEGSTKAFEMWHTILGVRSAAPNVVGASDERNAYLRTARALWTRDWDLAGAAPAIVNPASPSLNVAIENPSLTTMNRAGIVLNSSASATSNPLQINRLMLSSLGGYLDARGDWPGGPNDVARWVHKMAGGRESFVEIDTPGYLLPFGNSATSITVTRRNDDPTVGTVGELYSYNLIIIGNPVTSYRSAGLQTATQNALYQWPFLAVELKKTHFVTQRFTLAAGQSGWPVDASGTPIMVPAVGYDRRGRAVDFSVPLVFSPNSVPGATALTNYHALIAAAVQPAAPRTTVFPAVGSVVAVTNNPNTAFASLNVPMGGQRIAYADSKTTSAASSTASPTTAPPRDDTSFATQLLSFDVKLVTNGDSFQAAAPPATTATPQFVPAMTNASIYVEALHQYLRNTAGGTMPAVNAWYHLNFLNATAPGFDLNANKSQLLFSLSSPTSATGAITADFTKDPTGAQRSDGGSGFVAPNMTFNALSRKTGPAYDGSVALSSSASPSAQLMHPMGGAANTFVDGAFDPSVYLGMASSALSEVKILGVFSILNIVKTVLPAEATADLTGLVSSAEEAALKYAPKFIAQGLSEIQTIISLISEVKSQVELLYTNAMELVGTGYTGGAPLSTGALYGLASSSVNGVVTSASTTATTVAGMVQTIMQDAQAFYGTSSAAGLQATIGAIESLNIEALAGTASQPGSILQLIQNGNALLASINALANYGARATINAKPVALNGTAYSPTVPALPGGSIVNTALQIASGVQQSFGNKLQQLMTALQFGATAVQTVETITTNFTTAFAAAEQALDAVEGMTVKIEWQPKIGSWGPTPGFTIFRPATQHGLTLTMELTAKATDTTSAGLDLTCRLDHFDLCIGQTSDGNGGTTGIVSLQFDHISLDINTGSKPDVDVKINGLVFAGPLAFLQTLQNIIPMDGFSDPPFLNVTTSGISAGFTLQIPNVAVGMFSLMNMAITAELDMPLVTSGSATSGLTFTFSFCDADHPFIVTVSMLGGGGYFVVSFTPTGLEYLQASISVGAQLALNLLDIAQGSVSIMAGITFTIDNSSGTQDVSLTAFLRLQGELDILSIITISVVLSVSMTYDFTHKMIIAEAEIKVDVSIVFFSINVDLPFRKEFHSCNNDPTVRQLMPPSASNVASAYWAEYCNAYA